MPLSARPDTELANGLEAWADAMVSVASAGTPGGRQARVTAMTRPTAGWSNETLIVRVAWPDYSDEVVIRMPASAPLFPAYDLSAQDVVQRALCSAGLPAARPIALETDSRWLGAPFLVMERVPGTAVGEIPALDPWITGASIDDQRRVQDAFIDLLAAVHRIDWASAGLGDVLRGAAGDLSDEVAWWIDYVDWADAGRRAGSLRRLLEWCASSAPNVPSDGRVERMALCWGDPRLGNVMFDDNRRITAALDWELASIGPPEMDLAWYLALDELAAKATSTKVPGFVDRGQMIARYERARGFPVQDLRWHEIFALVRSAAVNERQACMAAELGVAYPAISGENNPMLAYVERRIARYERGP